MTDISNFPFPSSFQNTETRYFVLCRTYAGSISDNDLPADCGVLNMIQDEGATVLTDKGFGIEDVSCQRPFT